MARRALMCLSVLVGVGAAGAPAADAGSADRSETTRGGPIRMAQISLELGVSDATVHRALRREGYRDIEIFYRGMTKARVRACKAGARYQLEVAPGGRIKAAAKIGTCRVPLNLAQARGLLRKRGFRNVVLEPVYGGAFRGAACRGPERIELEMDPFGGVRELRRLGRCRHLLTRPEVAARLRSRGYSRIRFADTPPPPFRVTACRDLERVRLVVVGSGRIQRERPIGRCEPAISPRRIAEVVARHGYTRVRVTDDVLPRYAAEGCRDGVRFEVVLNRFGEIRKERRLGRCAPPLTRARLAERLRADGFRSIRFIDGAADGFVVEACQGDRRLRINVSRFGETIFEKPLGPCRSPRLGKLIADFERRGLSGVSLYVEGCRDGRRVQIELDRFGTAVNRRRVGRCP